MPAPCWVSLAPRDLMEALKRVGKPSLPESRSVDARGEIDLKCGVSFTRSLTNQLATFLGDMIPEREGKNSKGCGGSPSA